MAKKMLGSSGSSDLKTIENFLIVVVILLAICFIFVGMLMTQSTGGFQKSKNTNFQNADISYTIPKLDSDNDTLPDIEENYKYGTNETNPDTDGDGMRDDWEVKYGVYDPITFEVRPDPNNPDDAYDDPDNDGYDFNGNGIIDHYPDKVIKKEGRIDNTIPTSSDYTDTILDWLIKSPSQYKGTMVRLGGTTGAQVIDAGNYDIGMGTNPNKEIFFNISDYSAPGSKVTVRVEPGGARPILLEKNNHVWVEGIFINNGYEWEIRVRGGEQFTNIQEYMYAKMRENPYVLDPVTGMPTRNETNPNNPDTDYDGMPDGWEAHYGVGGVNMTTKRWEWKFFLDPTNPNDRDADMDVIIDIVTGEEIPCPDALVNYQEYEAGTDPTRPDTDGDSFDHGDGILNCEDNNCNDFVEVNTWVNITLPDGSVVPRRLNPRNPDSDGDGMPDGWEMWYFGPDAALDPNNKFADPDKDGLYNFKEYWYNTNPIKPDTDGDGMWDGWEANNGRIYDSGPLKGKLDIDPTNPNDWNKDVDFDASGARVGDGLTNLEEFIHGTDPHAMDTDKDNLTDFDEVKGAGGGLGWLVVADGENMRYFTNATSADSDLDDTINPITKESRLDDEDGDGNDAPNEEFLDGADNDGDAYAQQHDGIDNDRDGVADDGPDSPWGRPESMDIDPTCGLPYRFNGKDDDGDGAIDDGPFDPAGRPEGVDEEIDLNDWNEIYVFHTNASNPDTDMEGLSDWDELFTDWEPDIPGMQCTDPTLSDTDADELEDDDEVNGVPIKLPGSTMCDIIKTNPVNPDTDNDGLQDGIEVYTDFDLSTPVDATHLPDSTNPCDPDTDNDGMEDGYEYDNSDLDGDGLPTMWENQYRYAFLFDKRLDPTLLDTDGDGIIDSKEDFDNDGLDNLAEYMYRCSPIDGATHKTETGVGIPDALWMQWMKENHTLTPKPVYIDTDGDGMADWYENYYGLNPRDPSDKYGDPDGDDFRNIDEYIYNTNCTKQDTDDDGVLDWADHEFLAVGYVVTDEFTGEPTYVSYAYDGNNDSIADWWQKYYFGDFWYVEPTYSEMAAPDADPDNDNLTNLQEYLPDIHTHETPITMDPVNVDLWPYTQRGTNPLTNNTDGDTYKWGNWTYQLEDKYDPKPVNITPPQRIMNPIGPDKIGVNPLNSHDAYGDADQDMATNYDECNRPKGSTNASDPDSDQDGMPDGWEIIYGKWNESRHEFNIDPTDPTDAYEDPDHDGYNWTLGSFNPDTKEYTYGERDWNRDGRIDFMTENDSYCNLAEYLFGMDKDCDGINENTTDPNFNDTDYDGMHDGYEVANGDNDFDGLPNLWEIRYGTDPFNPDLDNDGTIDSLQDWDLDGWNNKVESQKHTNPFDADTDGDFINDPQDADPLTPSEGKGVYMVLDEPAQPDTGGNPGELPAKELIVEEKFDVPSMPDRALERIVFEAMKATSEERTTMACDTKYDV